MLTQDDLERERYSARMKAIRDQRTNLYAAREEGLEQGLEIGHEQGLEQGLEQGHELGLEQGLRQSLKLLLIQRFVGLPDRIEQRIDQATTKQLQAWFSQALKASSLAEIFPDLHH